MAKLNGVAHRKAPKYILYHEETQFQKKKKILNVMYEIIRTISKLGQFFKMDHFQYIAQQYLTILYMYVDI